MRVLVTGAGGQLGQELARAEWPDNAEISALDRESLDIADAAAVTSTVTKFSPDIVVNAAAYTAVDAAESDEDRATLVNGTAVGHLVAAANEADAFLIHVSTDYVFDGTANGWYRETDSPSPVSAYGRSKLWGEVAMTEANKGVTLRTAWVYGALAGNFVATILRLINERNQLAVVGDQFGCPTSTADLAKAIVQLSRWTDGGVRLPPSRLYHLVGGGEASWHDVALAVIEATSAGFAGPCNQISTDEYPTPARRPTNSRLSTELINTELDIALPHWRESLPKVVTELEEHTCAPI